MQIAERRNARVGELDDFALDIVGRARPAKEKRRPILLCHPLDIFDQSRGPADADNQHSGCQGIKRAGMSRLGGADQPGDAIDRPP